MKLLIIMGLSDRLMEHYLFSLRNVKNIEKIIIIRDKKGPKLKKVNYHPPSNWILKLPGLKYLYKLFYAISKIKKEKPDIIHSYLLVPHGIIALLAGKICNIKVGTSLIAGPFELYNLGKSTPDKYAYCRPLPKITSISKIYLKLLKKFDFITTTGSYTKKFLLNNNVQKNKIFIMPRIAPGEFDDRYRATDKQKEIDVLYVGRLVKMKHVDTLIEAIKLVKEEVPNVKTTIVGDGPEMKNLISLTKSLKLSENIDFVGYQKNVWSFYTKTKIAVITSDREGLPYSSIEALSCGAPVITSNCGDIQDVVKNDYNGTIIQDYSDYKSFAKEIISILKDKKKLNTYSINAIKTSKNLKVENVIDMWENVLKSHME